MIATFMQDDELKLAAHILVDISRPLEMNYYETLKSVAAGWNQQSLWASGRSVGAWLSTVTDILKVLDSEQLYTHLGMSIHLGHQTSPDPSEWPAWAQGEETILSKAFDFAVSLAGHWLWANVHFWLELPSLVASVLHHDQEIKNMAYDHMKKLADAVCCAEKVEKLKMKELISDLGWPRQYLARECMALILQNNTGELVKLAKRLSLGTPTTKDCLENTFAFLHRKAQVNSPNHKFADMTKYLYTIMSPYAESGGCPQILPTAVDMSTMQSPQGFAARQKAHRDLFSPESSLFPNPAAVPKPGKGSKTVRVQNGSERKNKGFRLLDVFSYSKAGCCHMLSPPKRQNICIWFQNSWSGCATDCFSSGCIFAHGC